VDAAFASAVLTIRVLTIRRPLEWGVDDRGGPGVGRCPRRRRNSSFAAARA